MNRLLLAIVVSIIGHICFAQWTDSGSELTTSDNVSIGVTGNGSMLSVGGGSNGKPIVSVNNTWGSYNDYPENNRPFTLRRHASDNESISTFVQDGVVFHHYRNDETSSKMIYRFVNTDTESGGGINANATVPLTLYGSSAGGKVAINSQSVPSGYHFAVDGKAIMEEVNVRVSESWPDYVFAENYELRSLEETESFIRTYHRLPEMPSAKQVEEEGIELGEMNRLLLEKVEELTLHVIELLEKLKTQERKNQLLERRLEVLEKN
ncbi:MAG: hypothetical protein KI790_11005 [Cyclobacteriaceae bacterium]|nr:hypothetical protein [Cyclobacteriaceae bacterium HetDA_MAG_MS6]